MSFDPLSAAFDLGKTAIEKIWPDANKRAEELRKLEELRQAGDLAALNAHVQIMVGQIKTNQIEAGHKSVFVAGWRPAIGWICAVTLGFNYIGIYLLEYAYAIIKLYAPDGNIPPLPQRMDMSELWPVLVGMLGIGGMRSYDKLKGNQTDRIR